MQLMLGPNSIEVTSLGDSAIRIEVGDQPKLIQACHQRLVEKSLPSILDVVPAYETVVIHFDGDRCHHQELYDWLVGVFEENLQEQNTKPSLIKIPVLYDGQDLEALVNKTGLTNAEIIKRHSGNSYRVRMIGFMPGFPYLEGLDESLAMSRRSVPRTKVPAGSVGIGGTQTGVYPFDSPGGWNLLGRTPIKFFDSKRSSPSFLLAGDEVKFEPIGKDEFDKLNNSSESNYRQKVIRTDSAIPLFKVLKPGLQTTLQDLGRWGSQAIGVTPGGAMDRNSACLANWLVGNAESAPLLEIALVGPQLLALEEVTIAIVGASCNLPSGKPLKINAGQLINLQAINNGARCYLSLAGGFESEEVLGGKGTDLRAQFGGHLGRALAKGDQLFGNLVEPQTKVSINPHWFTSTDQFSSKEAEGRIRLVRGPQNDWFDESEWEAFQNKPFSVSSQSDRMGIRLDGKVLRKSTAEMRSEPTIMGAVQVPPNGTPIVLMADRQTVGGYPVIGVVATVDLPRLAQLAPGKKVRFIEISTDEAESLLAERRQNEAVLKQGIQQFIPLLTDETKRLRKTIDLNGDAGEGAGNDEDFIPLLTSVNIACGFHAGNEQTMRQAVQIACESGVAIGAHPGLEDRKNFGRFEMPLTPDEAFDLVLRQIMRLQRIVDEFGASIQHVKPHGALYHMAAQDAALAKTIVHSVIEAKGPTWIVGPPASQLESAALEAGLQFAAEAFADRRYDAKGGLLPRSEARAVLESVPEVVSQAVAIAAKGAILVESPDSDREPSKSPKVSPAKGPAKGDASKLSTPGKIPLRAKTLCLHGDTVGAVFMAKSVREGLEKADIRVQRFGSC